MGNDLFGTLVKNIPMKTKLLIVAIIFAFASCSSDKLDIAKAKETAEKCLTAIDKEDYTTVINEYYGSEFGSSQTPQELTDKFKKLKEVTGPMKSFELKASDNSTETMKESSATLTYSVKHERVTTSEIFIIVIESGKYKISSHNITNE